MLFLLSSPLMGLAPIQLAMSPSANPSFAEFAITNGFDLKMRQLEHKKQIRLKRLVTSSTKVGAVDEAANCTSMHNQLGLFAFGLFPQCIQLCKIHVC